MKNHFDIANKLLEIFTILCEKYNINSLHYIVESDKNEDKIKFHNEAMDIIAGIIGDDKNVSKVVKELGNISHMIDFNSEKDAQKAVAYNYLNLYLDGFAKVFYTIKDGKYNYTNVEKIDNIDDPREHRNKYAKKCCWGTEYPLIIKPDGSCYLAPTGHQKLCEWLYLSRGEDFHSSLRIDADKRYNSFDFSSMKGYTDNNDSELHIKFTYDQAEALGKIYKALTDAWFGLDNFERGMICSTGFDLGFSEEETEVSARNLNILTKMCSDIFNPRDYRSQLDIARRTKVHKIY